MKVEEIPAGRRLDALVAEKVMGWHKAEQDGTWRWRDDSDDCLPNCLASKTSTIGYEIEDAEPWSPSTDIRAAWEVVTQQLQKESWLLQLIGPRYFQDGKETDGWFVSFYKADPPSAIGDSATTLPVAICRAALKAVGVTEVPD